MTSKIVMTFCIKINIEWLKAIDYYFDQMHMNDFDFRLCHPILMSMFAYVGVGQFDMRKYSFY